MSLSSDFAARLDAQLATFTSDEARRVFLQSQARTWRTRYFNFCHRPRPSNPGDVQPTATDFLLTIGEIDTRLGRLPGGTVETRAQA
jgi:hypothetical protein